MLKQGDPGVFYCPQSYSFNSELRLEIFDPQILHPPSSPWLQIGAKNGQIAPCNRV
jgi:hypothetical protein